MDEEKKVEATAPTKGQAQAAGPEGEGAAPEKASKAGTIRTIALLAVMLVVAVVFVYVRVYRTSARYHAARLQSPEVTERIAAINALSNILEDREMRLQNVSEAELATRRTKAVIKLKSAIPALIAAMRDEAIPVRAHAASILRVIAADDEDAIARLIRSLEGGTLDSKRLTIPLLPALGPKAIAAVDALLEQINTDEAILRKAALDALMQIAPEEQKVVERVFAGFGDKDSAFRGEIVRHAAALANRNQELVARIIKELDADDGNRRVTAARTLFGVRPQDEKLLAVLFGALKHPAADVRQAVAVGLIGIAHASKPVRARLTEASAGLEAKTQEAIAAGLKIIEENEQRQKAAGR